MANWPTFNILRGPDEQSARVQDNINTVLAPVAKALQNTPIMGGASPAWVTPSLLNGWEWFGSGYMQPGYHRDALGYVHLRGLVKNAAAGVGVVIFTLPIGVRPNSVAQSIFSVAADGNFARLDILRDGSVLVASAVSATPQNYVSLDGLTFLAEA